jgi:hypothetical protein
MTNNELHELAARLAPYLANAEANQLTMDVLMAQTPEEIAEVADYINRYLPLVEG